MKKHYLLTNKKGFFLPYVLFITALVFIIISANIKIYKNELELMDHLTEQIDVETLLQMSSMKYVNDMKKAEDFPNHQSYHFPSGDVTVSYISHNNRRVTARYDIITEKNTEFTIKKTVNLSQIK